MGNNRLVKFVLILQALTLAGLWLEGPRIPQASAQIPDSGALKQQTVDELREISAKLDRLVTLMESGRLQVKVVRSDENKGASAR